MMIRVLLFIVCYIDPIISEQFEMNTVSVTLEWTRWNPLYLSYYYGYHINVIPPAQTIIGDITSVQMNVSYNVSYNLTILSAFCRENLQVFTQLFYYSECYLKSGSKIYIALLQIAYCRDPAHQIEDAMEVFGYVSLAIPGSSVTFDCSLPGYSLVGSNMSICMRNGEWEPHPREAIKCKGVSNDKYCTTFTITIVQQTVVLHLCLQTVTQSSTQVHLRELK